MKHILNPFELGSSGLLEKQMGQAIEMAEEGKKASIPYPLPSLRQTMVGAALGEMLVIGGRPNHGKSTYAGWMALEWALDRTISESGFKGVILSREMMAWRFIHKFIAMTSEFTSRELRAGVEDPERRELLREKASLLEKRLNGNLILFDATTLPDGGKKGVDQIARHYRPRFIVDDFLQITDMDDSNAHMELKGICKHHIDLSKELDMAYVGVSQLNRNVEHRDDPIPRTSDLAESDKIGQLAADVIMVYYPYKIDPRREPKNRVKIVSTKSRFGETGFVDVLFLGDHMKYQELPRRKTA